MTYDSLTNKEMQKQIRDRAMYSLAVIGMGAVYRAEGRFLNIRPVERRNLQSVEDTV